MLVCVATQRRWIEACIRDTLPPPSQLEEALRNGVILARLSMFFAPDAVKPKMIFDLDEKVYHVRLNNRI